MSKHLLLSILYLIFLMDGIILDVVGYTVSIYNWQVDLLVSLSGFGLVAYSIIKLVYHFPKINSN